MEKKHLFAAGVVGLGALVGTVRFERAETPHVESARPAAEVSISGKEIQRTQKVVRRRVRIVSLPPLMPIEQHAEAEVDTSAEADAITEVGETIRKAHLVIESLRMLAVCSPQQAAFAGMKRWKWMVWTAESYEDLGEIIDSSDDQRDALDLVSETTGLSPKEMVDDIDHIGFSSEELRKMRDLILENY